MDVREVYFKYSWAVNLALLALLAFLCAQTANRYAAGQVMPAGGRGQLEVSVANQTGPAYSAPRSAIISRDLFDAAEKHEDLSAAALEGDTSGQVRETNLRLKLLGVARSSEWFATINNLKDQKIDVFRVGDKVTEDATVQEIHTDRVVLKRGNGDLEELLLEDKETPVASATPGPRSSMDSVEPPVFNRPPPGGGPDLSGKIKQIGENEYVVQRDAIESVMSNMNSIITQARVIPNFSGQGESRKIDGFRIYRIQRGSIFELLGLNNGDVIKSINGQSMDSVEKGLSLLQSLKDQSNFTMSIERQRQPVDLNYQVE